MRSSPRLAYFSRKMKIGPAFYVNIVGPAFAGFGNFSRYLLLYFLKVLFEVVNIIF
ncbi:MAG: hypothetical protein JWP00_1167 [Chloroflexi bacterium]|nr:hypothetical protein [Chloroflexota bacterium]